MTNPAAKSQSITMRPVTDDDTSLLVAIYATTRADELKLLSWWTDEQKAAFVQMQSDAQLAHYRNAFPQAEYSVVMVGDHAVGRLYTAELETDLRILDLTLLPDARNCGVGSFLLRQLLERARQMQKSLSIHVESYSPALRLFERLGFEKKSENGIYFLMQHAAKIVSAA